MNSFETYLPTACPGVSLPSAEAVLKLAGEGATVPFIARYRKEQTKNLDEVAIQKVIDAKERWDAILKRQTFIVEEIERQKKLTPELKDKILATFDADVLEDLYLPYKRKRKSKALLAKEAGLEPLADWIWNCCHGTEQPLAGQTLEIWAYTFRNEEKEFKDLEAVLQGALDILTERIAEIQSLRQIVRAAYFEKGVVSTKKAEKAKPHSKYDNYFDYHEPVAALREPKNSHRYLALRRGFVEEELSLALTGPPEDKEFSERLAAAFIKEACSVPDSPGAELIEKAARLALTAHVVPSIESEVHRTLKTIADEVAIAVFADNVRQLLLASPFGSKAVLGVDPGVRTGCKLALISETGQFLDSATIHLRNDDEKEKAKPALSALLDKTPVLAIAVGNGTAGRETADFLRAAVKEQGRATPVVMVSEAGASVYSASAVAREEFPALDVSLRGAISIARRLQDPLAELVKIDPKSIGVGQYQHDVSPSGLKSSIERVVDSCVNQVGVNLNTASHHLLAHISGLGPALARAVVDHRVTHGLFRSRRQLLDVPRFSQKTFEQAAGFLRIPDGDVPFDNTGVHPERYPLLNGLAASLNIQPADLLGAGVERVRAAAQLREEIGAFTFDDIVKELEKPGRDPRQEFVAFEFRDDIHAISDLKKGMVCPGIVTNVTNFGAFVDIGVHHDGLVHISRLAERFVKDPREVVKPGDRVEVRVVEVDLEKIQISLSMKPEPKPVAAKKTARPRRPARREASAEAGVPAATSAKPSRPRPAPRPKREQPARADAQPQKGALPAAPPAPAAGPAGPARPRFDKKPQPQAAPSRDNRRPQRTREVFNNPFAALAGMKFDTKKK